MQHHYSAPHERALVFNRQPSLDNTRPIKREYPMHTHYADAADADVLAALLCKDGRQLHLVSNDGGIDNG